MEGAVLRVDELAQLLGCTPKAVRQRVARGQVPPPFRFGRALAWLRESVLEWLRDCSRSAGPAQMNIHLRPYKNDPTRWTVDIKLMHPGTQREIRKRMVAPVGLSEAQARAWGERQVPKILGAALGAQSEEPTPPKQPKKIKEARRITTCPQSHLAQAADDPRTLLLRALRAGAREDAEAGDPRRLRHGLPQPSTAPSSAPCRSP
jgi:predicted DNA-binding transcriptional regulator AlpA